MKNYYRKSMTQFIDYSNNCVIKFNHKAHKLLLEWHVNDKRKQKAMNEENHKVNKHIALLKHVNVENWKIFIENFENVKHTVMSNVINVVWFPVIKKNSFAIFSVE